LLLEIRSVKGKKWNQLRVGIKGRFAFEGFRNSIYFYSPAVSGSAAIERLAFFLAQNCTGHCGLPETAVSAKSMQNVDSKHFRSPQRRVCPKWWMRLFVL
jgi:hypothetical protein